MQTLKVSQIAEILGTTVKTVNNHRNKGKLSTQADGDGHQAATPIEIQRAYENKYPDIGRRIREYIEGEEAANKNSIVSQKPETKSSTNINELLKNQEDRHEKELDRLEAVYEKSDERMSKMLNLLEHHTKESEDLKNTVKQLIERDKKREAELEKLYQEKIEREAAAKKKSEEEEAERKRKEEEELEAAHTWVSRMFSKKKTA